jgi:hydroxyacylglutathione hydrolase
VEVVVSALTGFPDGAATLGVDYPAWCTYQPDETPLELTTEHLDQIRATLRANDLQPGRYVLPQMIITPVS